MQPYFPATFLGRDYEVPGQIDSWTDPTGQIATAISQGMTDKANEDAMLAVVTEAGAVLAVADGHWGREAAEHAIEKTRDLAPQLLAGDSTNLPHQLRVLVEGINRDFCAPTGPTGSAARTGPAGSERTRTDRAETTLIVCVVRAAEQRAWWASFGDSFLFHIKSRNVELLNEPRRVWLGERAAGQIAAELEVQSLAFGRQEALLLATDGLVEPHPDRPRIAWELLANALQAPLAPVAKVRSLASMALSMGGRDNVTCALYEPGRLGAGR